MSKSFKALLTQARESGVIVKVNDNAWTGE